MVIRILQLRFY